MEGRPKILQDLAEASLTFAFRTKGDNEAPKGVLTVLVDVLHGEARSAAVSLSGLLETPSSSQPLEHWQTLRTTLRSSHPLIKHGVTLV